MRSYRATLFVTFGFLIGFGLLSGAAWGCTSGSVNAGGIFCTTPTYFDSLHHYSTSGTADQIVKWSVWYGTTSTPDTRLDHLTDYNYGPIGFNTGAGYYQTCLNNNTSGVTVNFTICD
jgi:hypothetical protein